MIQDDKENTNFETGLHQIEECMDTFMARAEEFDHLYCKARSSLVDKLAVIGNWDSLSNAKL